MLIWEEHRHSLGLPAMDLVHREFLALADEVRRAGPEDFPLLFDALCEHTREHFAHEGELMRRCAFPALAEHESEHRRIQGHLDRLRDRIAEGHTAMARVFVKEVAADWFPGHLTTMDAALAACLRRQSAAFTTAEPHPAGAAGPGGSSQPAPGHRGI